MAFSSLVNELIQSLRCLPGVGPKSATRMVFYLLERDRKGASRLANCLSQAIAKIGKCELCQTLCETKRCSICLNVTRDQHILCIVESPIDVLALEQTKDYKGLYYVLLGHLSPIDGIGPEELGLAKLQQRLEVGDIREIILATNTTVEGEATAYYISEMAKAQQIKTTRIARGVPMGGELEHLDGNTLSRALTQREAV